jgi:hypothetical protein
MAPMLRQKLDVAWLDVNRMNCRQSRPQHAQLVQPL